MNDQEHIELIPNKTYSISNSDFEMLYEILFDMQIWATEENQHKFFILKAAYSIQKLLQRLLEDE